MDIEELKAQLKRAEALENGERELAVMGIWAIVLDGEERPTGFLRMERDMAVYRRIWRAFPGGKAKGVCQSFEPDPDI